MELLSKKPSIFGVRDVPLEIVARRRKYIESRERAREYFDAIYGERATSVLLANITAAYTKKFRKSPSSFEEAWSKLGYQETAEIFFRAVNHLPCPAKDTGEMEEFLKQKKSDCGNSRSRKNTYLDYSIERRFWLWKIGWMVWLTRSVALLRSGL